MPQENTEALNEALNTPTEEVQEYSDDDSYTPANTEEAEEESTEETVEAAAEEEPKVETEEDDEEPKPLSRGQQRFQNLANEKRALQQEKELLARQLELERQQRARPQEEENLTELEKWQRQANQTIQQVQFQTADMADKSNFLMQVSKNPAEAAYIDRVEARLMEARRQGFNPNREDVLLRLMGEDARSKVKQAPTVKREAAARVKAATGKPVAAKSNVASTKAESNEFDRLKGIRL